MDTRTEQIFSPRKHADSQQTHEKMINIINHQGNIDQSDDR